MKSAYPDGGIAHQRFDPPLHFVGRFVGESQGENLLAGDVVGQKPSHAMGDDPGFSAAGPGKDQKRPFDMRDGFALSFGKSIE